MQNNDSVLLDKLKDLNIRIANSRGRNIQCYCPVSKDEKHPSFFFNLDTQLYHCFGCDLGGQGINRLTEELTGLKSDPTVLQSLPDFTFKEEKKTIPSVPFLPLAIGNPGEDYLKKRGFSSSTIKMWNLMYWPEKDGILIPINTTGYVLRYIHPPDKKDKYWYVPGTRVGDTFFGIDKFEEVDDNSAIIVEGSFDVIWMWQCGFKNALAILHGNITPTQLKILRGVAVSVFLMLDNDAGGVSIRNKLVPMLKDFFIIRSCTLPEGKDPQECSTEEIKKAVADSI
jgi:DNA primase